MHGLVSLLSEPHYRQVESIWFELEEKYGLRGIQVTPLPHFSWQIADHYDQDRLFRIMKDFAANHSIFSARTCGLGIFTSESPVVFIPVVKNKILMEMHHQLWESTRTCSQNRSDYYSPDSWMPHISISYLDVSPDNIGKITSMLAFRDFNWEIEVDNISFIYEPDGEIGQLKNSEKFSKQDQP